MLPAAYLDWNATAPLAPEARDAMVAALDLVGNPSSVHGPGRAARRLVEEAREAVAALVGAAPAGVVFTAGATEANATAIAGLGRSRVLASAAEHDSVLAARGPDGRAVETVP
ncbi:MAG: aminotransferase class V-fold PLP-dependent enzyme, partial [Alphaproteobacteria bacterium]|nr:aminotransferase class V-fold PLP-dependent enzyme [Alphaproteobacteria bacterium]